MADLKVVSKKYNDADVLEMKDADLKSAIEQSGAISEPDFTKEKFDLVYSYEDGSEHTVEISDDDLKDGTLIKIVLRNPNTILTLKSKKFLVTKIISKSQNVMTFEGILNSPSNRRLTLKSNLYLDLYFSKGLLLEVEEEV